MDVCVCRFVSRLHKGYHQFGQSNIENPFKHTVNEKKKHVKISTKHKRCENQMSIQSMHYNRIICL